MIWWLWVGASCVPSGTDSAVVDTTSPDTESGDTASTETSPGDTADPTDTWEPPPAIADHVFGDFVDWAAPIEDVLAAGEEAFGDDFSRGIHELTAQEDRLWIGYGDANVNLGGVYPITFRSFASADDSEVLVGSASGEEQMDRFRWVHGDLWMAGVDSLGTDEEVHFPLIGGNVYTFGDEEWSKFNTVPGGEHVHDVAGWGGEAWAVGSGANDRDEFESGQIHRYLWRSLDDGESWMTMQREPYPDPGSGDTRFVHLLPQADDLYLFGYEYDWVAGVVYVINARFDGWDLVGLTNAESLEDVYPFGTLSVTEEVGLVWGVDVDEFALINEAWVVEDGERVLIDDLDGRSVIDVALRPDTEEILFLSYAGDVYGEAFETWDLKVHLAQGDDPQDLVELASWSTSDSIRSVAFFDGSLFVGTDDGRVLRAAGEVE